ncbi:23S rRNA (uracil(1939)-C(5))-methyltransferase RlmD [Candidatus Gracilibacteria bacterium]|nr:23S rRNA (uracil(1939)-C(5))-methyltransferase RlmD [Candidatus Gracilibacteria bacterium]
MNAWDGNDVICNSTLLHYNLSGLLLERFFMKRGEIIENIEIEKLVFGGKGFVRLEDGKVAFITGGAIPGSRVNIKITKKRKDFYEAQITEVLVKSKIETENYDLFPGAPWMNIDYKEQLKIKQTQIEESMFHLRKHQPEINFLDIIPAPKQFGYRNKIEFSFGKYISHREEIFEDFNVGFHKRGEFSKVEDYDECLLIDDEQNKIYKKIKDFAKDSGLPVYDQKIGTGFFRHLMIRKMHFSGEILLVFSVFSKYFESLENTDLNEKEVFDEIKIFLKNLAEEEKNIKSTYISHNSNKADTLIGDMELVYGNETISENLLGLSFDIGPKSFFQTNSEGAEILYSLVKDFAKQEELSNGTVLDLYGGTGTIGMIFADIAKNVVSVELNEEASTNGAKNALKNGIENIEFVNAKVEDFLEKYLEQENKAELLIIDPPRAGMHPSALPNILKFGTRQIIYVSCNPATLARDLGYILENSDYKIEKIQAVDMFPHTHHIETVVSLTKKLK